MLTIKIMFKLVVHVVVLNTTDNLCVI
eukprot:SAG11_NODE_17538_length_515_cov_1.370192_1_plen_27_part_10